MFTLLVYLPQNRRFQMLGIFGKIVEVQQVLNKQAISAVSDIEELNNKIINETAKAGKTVNQNIAEVAKTILKD